MRESNELTKSFLRVQRRADHARESGQDLVTVSTKDLDNVVLMADFMRKRKDG